MPTLKPFRGIQGKPDFVERIAANVSDHYSVKEMIQEMQINPLSFLRLSQNHLLKENGSQNSEEFFQNAKDYISYLVDNEFVDQFKDDIYFVYRQTLDNMSHTGIIGLCDMDDYQHGKILKHENTRPATEKFVAKLVESTEMIGEPLLLSHHHKQSLEDLLRWVIQCEPDIAFEKKQKAHQIWIIQDPELLEAIAKEVTELEEFYIMDGHHRAASMSRLHKAADSEKYRYCLTYLLDCNQLSISSFHRLVEDDSMTTAKVIEALKKHFWIDEIPEYAVHPEKKGEFILKCISGNFSLKLKESNYDLDVVELEEKILSEVFEVEDSRLDERIRFISKNDELVEAIVQSQTPGSYLFLLNPCNFEDIALVSDNMETMPPKSTFVQPKCDAGLFLQALK